MPPPRAGADLMARQPRGGISEIMINPVLDRRFADCSELVEAWKAYLDQFTAAVKAPDASGLTAEAEQRFMHTKARVAMLHDSFLESLKHDKNVGQNMIALVNRSITLRHLRKLSPSDQKKIEIEWHECYLLLNETVGQLGEERDQLANVNEFNHKMNKMKETILLNIKWFFTSIWFKLIVAFAILFGLIGFVVYMPDTLAEKVIANGKVGPHYRKVMDFRRDVLGGRAPYSSLDKFRSRLDKAPSGWTVTDASGAKESASFMFANMLQVDGGDAKPFLDGAANFKAYTISPPNQPPITANVFHWDAMGPAGKFASAYGAGSRDPNNMNIQGIAQFTTVLANNNVLIVLTQGRPEDREQLARSLR